MTDIPHWRSHKVVQAAKITGMQFPPGGPVICMGDIPAKAAVTPAVLARMVGMTNPKPGDGEAWANLVGGYYIRYADGYESWSPADAFQQGYRRVIPNEWAEKGLWAAETDDLDWDCTTGAPKLSYFAGALQVWSACQQGEVTVQQGADAFNVPPATIRAAVEWHYWMFLSGPDDKPAEQLIEHEGE